MNARPPIYLEKPRRLSIPLAIRLYGHRPTRTTVQTVQKTRWGLRSKPTLTLPTVKKRKLHQYKRKATLSNLKANAQREKKLPKKEKKDAIKHEKDQILKRLEEIEEDLSSDTSLSGNDQRTKIVAKRTKKAKKEILKAKKLYISEKSHVKPRAASRSVSVKEQKSRYDELSIRFVNCFYRFCCQLYCYLTCFLVIGFVGFVIF